MIYQETPQTIEEFCELLDDPETSNFIKQAAITLLVNGAFQGSENAELREFLSDCLEESIPPTP